MSTDPKTLEKNNSRDLLWFLYVRNVMLECQRMSFLNSLPSQWFGRLSYMALPPPAPLFHYAMQRAVLLCYVCSFAFSSRWWSDMVCLSIWGSYIDNVAQNDGLVLKHLWVLYTVVRESANGVLIRRWSSYVVYACLLLHTILLY